MNDSSKPWLVLKFGGSSVSRRQHWQTIAQKVKGYHQQGFCVFVVCSAIRGVTDWLEQLLAIHNVHTSTKVAKAMHIYEQLQVVHEELATSLGIDMKRCIGQELAVIRSFARDADTAQVSAKVQAQVMALGEVMSSRIGAQWLANQGFPVVWRDARDFLTCKESPYNRRHYLAATCDAQADVKLQQLLYEQNAKLVVTQGFIAKDARGDTVLLGRGGSDTSAAYLAARLQAKWLEIWSDVPGLYTSDPRKDPSAELLYHLDYDQAERLALQGAKVLHPRCIAPVRLQGIPLHIRCTDDPDLPGTCITSTRLQFQSQRVAS